MMRKLILCTVLLAWPAMAAAQTIFTEDFESGLGAWTQAVYSPDGPCGVNNNTPIVFDSSGQGPEPGTDDDIHGDNTNYPGSQAAGFSSNLDSGCFDGQQPQWIEIQWPGLLDPGVYNVVILVDRYVYIDSDRDGQEDDEDQYGLGDRIYVLTDTRYDDPYMNYDGDMGIDGSRWSKWSNKEPGSWEIGAIKRDQDIETTDGDVELRLLMHEKAAGFNTVAWDNLTMTLRDSGTGAVVFTYPSGTAGTLTTRTDADNGVVTSVGHGLAQNDVVDVSWGASGIRRMKVTGVSGDDVTLTGVAVGANDPLPAQDTGVVLNKPEDFEDGLAGWTAKVWGNGTNNDVPQTFTATDPALYTNQDNPGSTSAGYSSDMVHMDFTRAAWLQRQFAAAVAPGSYEVTFEYDAYVYRYARPSNDTPAVFPSDGSGIEGPNNNYPGSNSAGWSSDLEQSDGSGTVWFQQQFPAAVPPGTYDFHVEADVYAYEEGGDYYGAAARLYLLTDDRYDDPTWNPEGDASPGYRWTTWDGQCNGSWIHQDKTGSLVTTTGNIEIRLLYTQKYTGAQSAVFDNVSYTLTDPNTQEVVFSLEEDFETNGYDAWTVVVHPNDPYEPGDPFGVGNRMYILTDDLYDDVTYNFDTSPGADGVREDYWPGMPDWSMNGVWRQHVVQKAPLTTDTGNIEVRLLLHDKNTGAQAVAWDNLTLTFNSPPGACCLADASCVETDQYDCEVNLEGHYQGEFTTCDDPGILCCPDPFADADTDGDVDQGDWAIMQLCLTEQNAGVIPAGCECFDREPDLDVDEIDVTAFENCASGPGVPANRSCDDPPM